MNRINPPQGDEVSMSVGIRVWQRLQNGKSSSNPFDLEVTLVYKKSDPYAVHLVFRDEMRTTWTFARSLMSGGVEEPTGIGDVLVRPGVRDGDRFTFMELSSPDGLALIRLYQSDVEDFLRRTYEMVPRNKEAVELDLGKLLGD